MLLNASDNEKNTSIHHLKSLHFAYEDRRNVEIRFRYDHEIHLGPEEAVDRSQCLHRTSMLWMWWMVVKFQVGMVRVSSSIKSVQTILTLF